MNPQLLRGFSINWNQIHRFSYIRDIPALRGLQELSFHAPVTFFVGENGSGKSTLLEALAIGAGFNPEGGTRNYDFSTYDSHSDLSDALRLIRGHKYIQWGFFLRAESFYNVATQEAEYNKASGRPPILHNQSHGESFLEMLQDQMSPDSLYFLDEPEAALSPQRQLSLLIEINRCAKEGSQFIIATHSPILLGLPGAEILSFDGEIHPITYEETDSYKITHMFVNQREQFMRQLLMDEC